MLFANVCAGFIRSCYGELWVWRFFLFVFLASLRCPCVYEGVLVLLVPVVHKTLVTLVCLLPDLPFGWRSVGALPFVTSGEDAWQLIKLPVSILGLRMSSGCGSHIC